MNAENTDEKSIQENNPREVGTTNKWLIVGVCVVAVVSIGIYVYKFWGQPLSTNTSDWADFATYLSGTVGVAAVVATLFAFVKTLGQQQELIDSQDKMLIEQKRQINLAEIQNVELENRHKIEIAYSNTREILPSLITSFETWVDSLSLPYHDSELRDTLKLMIPAGYSSTKYIMDNPDLFSGLVHGSYLNNADDFLKIFFEPIHRLYEFVCQQVAIAPVLRGYFDAKLWVAGPNHTKFLFHCYQAYLIGKGDFLYKKGESFLDLKSDYKNASASLDAWQNVGVIIADAN